MHDNWQRALTFVWQPRFDGQAYHTTPNDHGGGTAWGVTDAIWVAAVHLRMVDAGMLQNATQEQLATVLRLLFWNVVQGDELNDGVDIAVFNAAMLSGPGVAARLLQKIVGTTMDGHVGRLTLIASQHMDAAVLISRFTAAYEAHLGSLRDASIFGRGWMIRTEACQHEALACMRNSPTVVNREVRGA